MATDKHKLAQQIISALLRVDPVSMVKVEIPPDTAITIITSHEGLQVTVKDNEPKTKEDDKAQSEQS